MFGGDDTEAKRQKKRKRQNNPLSQARGKKTNENIWFRRSKAGYSLFIQYYLSQPAGTISSCVKAIQSSNPDSSAKKAFTGNNDKKTGGGLSRAAKRRKKQKKRQAIPAASQNDSEAAQVPGEEVTPFNTVSAARQERTPLLVSEYSKQICAATTSVKSNVEFETFLKAMSRPLPLSFRIRQLPKDTDFEEAIKRLGGAYFSNLVEAVPFGNTTMFRAMSKPNSVQLCKENLNKVSPALKEFLVDTSQSGIIARQEIGSMLPAIALHDTGCLQTGSKILDMCASPGSKTLQALEIIGRKGRVVANDVSESRLLTLRQALERSGVSPELLKRVHYTCQDGSKLESPLFKSKSKQDEKRRLAFNAVMCDVPCSGDGTARKDKHILPMWKPNYGNALHSLQVRILMRALKLVKVGGVVCYSTCTLNPIEDEAVVAAALTSIQSMKKKGIESSKRKEESKPAVELIDWPSLPGNLVGRPGISTWKVAEYLDDNESNNDGAYDSDDETEDAPKLNWYESFSDVMSTQEDKKKNSSKFVQTMWPPSLKKGQELHLERCVRLWPQDRDTGGFFLALIRKNCDFV